MKKALLIVLVSFSGLILNAQDSSSSVASKPKAPRSETLLSNKTGVGAFIGFETQANSLNGQLGMYGGAKFALALGGAFNMGVAGYRLSTTVFSSNKMGTEKLIYKDAFGGFLFEPIIANRKLLHVTFPVLVGAGVISENRDWIFGNSISEAWATYFVAQPALNIELNVARVFRIAAGAGYKFVTNTSLLNNSNINLSGFSTNITFKFGWFGR